jgi:hypothetical protein
MPIRDVTVEELTISQRHLRRPTSRYYISQLRQGKSTGPDYSLVEQTSHKLCQAQSCPQTDR